MGYKYAIGMLNEGRIGIGSQVRSPSKWELFVIKYTYQLPNTMFEYPINIFSGSKLHLLSSLYCYL